MSVIQAIDSIRHRCCKKHAGGSLHLYGGSRSLSGEVFLDERTGGWNAPYLFNAKELDEETGLYYYGARYYDPRLSLWLSTDPMQEKYPGTSSYCYAANNPVKFVDSDGNDIVIAGKGNSSVRLITDLIDINVNVSFLGVNWGGSYVLQGEEILSAALDFVGIADPTGLADGLNASLQFKNGLWMGALISSFGIVPYVGDLAKIGKVNTDIRIIESAIEVFKYGDKGKGIVHGNAKVSSKAQHVYEIFDIETKMVVKTGINGGKISKLGKSYRANRQVNKWNREAGKLKFDSKIVEEIPAGSNARRKALEAERINAQRLRSQGGLDQKYHKRP